MSKFFHSFLTEPEVNLVPDGFNNPFKNDTSEICKIAAQEVQNFLSKEQLNWKHNFGLNNDKNKADKGKMFGVLVVKNKNGDLGYFNQTNGS